MTHQAVHVIVPDAIDDPARPSGGNWYDHRLCSGLAGQRWPVHEHLVPDAWPLLGPTGAQAAKTVVGGLPDGALVLVDGLIASAAPQVFVPAAARLTLVVLIHMPADDKPDCRAAEATVLQAARAVVVTSAWTRERLLAAYPLSATEIHVAEPGVDPACLAADNMGGTRLLCVGPISAAKGHDVLVAALSMLTDQPWHCTCVGPLDRDPAFVTRLQRAIQSAGLADRLHLSGPQPRMELVELYRSAGVLVHASRRESFGMVVTEALARGLPVIGAAVGGLPDALGFAPDGTRPGLLVPPEDVSALADALRRWLTDAALRCRLRNAALGRRDTLPTWSQTARLVAAALTSASPGSA